jgi:hypothetical protein
MRSSLSLLAALPLVACTSHSPGPVTDPGESIFTSDVTRLVLEDQGGGFVRPPPPGSACDPQLASFAVTVAGHKLDWQFCEVSGPVETQTYTPRSGSRALDSAEWSALEPKLAALVVSDKATCGADKATLAAIVTTSGGELEYRDDFYACLDRTRVYVVGSGLDAALAAVGQLARK